MKVVLVNIMVLIISACSVGQTPVNGTFRTDSKSLGHGLTKPSLDTLSFYLGVSHDNSGRRAWLIKLDHDGGVLYMPPGNLRIRRPTISKAGDIGFETESGLGGIVYKFTGLITANTIVGKFSSSSDSTSVDNNEITQVSMERLNSFERQDHVEGLFSNARFVEESGDITGEEIVLIRTQGRLIGIITDFENEMVPFAFYPNKSKSKIAFDIMTSSGSQHFRGTLSTTEIRLNQIDQDIAAKSVPIVLRKKKEISDFFSALK